MKLNTNQEKFCLEYAASGNATASYQKVYGVTDETVSASCASKLLKNAKIQARLKELADELASAKIADARELQERLTQVIRREVTEEQILPSGERVQKQVGIRDMLKAIELLCRIQGAFVNRSELDVKGNVPIVIAGGDCLPD